MWNIWLDENWLDIKYIKTMRRKMCQCENVLSSNQGSRLLYLVLGLKPVHAVTRLIVLEDFTKFKVMTYSVMLYLPSTQLENHWSISSHKHLPISSHPAFSLYICVCFFSRHCQLFSSCLSAQWPSVPRIANYFPVWLFLQNVHTTLTQSLCSRKRGLFDLLSSVRIINFDEEDPRWVEQRRTIEQI